MERLGSMGEGDHKINNNHKVSHIRYKGEQWKDSEKLDFPQRASGMSEVFPYQS